LWKPGGGLTYRRVRVLLDRLPPESATKTAMRDEFTDEELAEQAKAHAGENHGHGPLTRTDLVLFDLLDALRWIEYGLYRSQGGKPPEPSPTPRPGLVDPKKNKKKELAGVAALNSAGLRHLQLLRATRGE
jgi:hypothetical protein